MNNINSLIQEAQQTAQTVETANVVENAQVVQEQSTLPANIPAHIASLAQPTKLSMATMQPSSLRADAWLKFSYYGMTTNKDSKTLIDELLVEINMTENSGSGFYLCNMVKWGNPATYVYTYDGVTGSDGRPWVESVTKAYNATPQNSDKPNTPYPAVQLPMVLLEDIVDKKGNVIVEKGKVLGYTTAKTAWYNWQDFYNSVVSAGLLGQPVKVKVTNEATEFNTNKWGVPKFELITD